MLEEKDDGFHGMLTFLLEGVLLLAVALVGLCGNLISFVTIFSQKIQKTFHNLLFLLTVFDMVSEISVGNWFQEFLEKYEIYFAQ